METILIGAILVATSASFASGGDSQREAVGLKLGMTAEEVISLLDKAVAASTRPTTKPVVSSLSVYGLPKYVAFVSGLYSRGDEDFNISAYFSPPPSSPRLAHIMRISTYKRGISGATLTSSLLAKYGKPSYVLKSVETNYTFLWAYASNGSPAALPVADVARAKRDMNSPDLGDGAMRIFVDRARDRMVASSDDLDEYVKNLQRSGAGFCVRAGFLQTSDGIVNQLFIDTVDISRSAESFEQLTHFVKDKEIKRVDQEKRNAAQTKPTL